MLRTLCNRLVLPQRRLCTVRFPEVTRHGAEDIEVLRARLVYQSKKRGILENDILLGGFAERKLKDLNKVQLKTYDEFVNGGHNEWDIYYWLSGAKEVPEEVRSDVFDMMVDYTSESGTIYQHELRSLTKKKK